MIEIQQKRSLKELLDDKVQMSLERLFERL